MRLYVYSCLSFKRLRDTDVMTQRKTAARKTLGILLGSEHCLCNALDGVVNQNTHVQGRCVTFTIMLRTVLQSDYHPAAMQHR